MGAQWKQKGREEAANAKGKIMSKLAKEIIVAAKTGADTSTNARLRMAVEAAKKASMTKETIERAIKKGSGQLDEAANYETVTYEGFGPHKVPVIVECLTDNKNRTGPNIRTLFRKGQLANSGAISWDFVRLGAIEATGAEDAEVAAIEAGAQDFEAADDAGTRFYTEPTDLDAVQKALAARKWNVTSAQLVWKAKNPVEVDATARAEVEAFLGDLDDDDDVQNIFVGLK